MAYSDKVIDHYNNPRNVGQMDKSSTEVGTGLVGAPECGDVMRLADQGESGNPGHRRSKVQDLRLRFGNCIVFAGDRVGEGQDGRGSAHDQEHRHREGARPSASQDSLFGACGRCDPRGDRRLEEEERSGRDRGARKRCCREVSKNQERRESAVALVCSLSEK